MRFKDQEQRPFKVTGGAISPRTAVSVSQVRGIVQGIQRNDPTRDVAVASARSGVFAIYKGEAR